MVLLILPENRWAAIKAPGSLKQAARVLNDLSALMARAHGEDLALVHRLDSAL